VIAEYTAIPLRNNGRVGLGGAVTVGPVERLLFVSLSPTAYLGGVEFA
jgi:hypothetical protein